MTNVLPWRKTTWILLLWGGYVPTWAVTTGSSPAVVAHPEVLTASCASNSPSARDDALGDETTCAPPLERRSSTSSLPIGSALNNPLAGDRRG